MSQAWLPLHLVLVDEQAHQFRDRERRVRVVELDRDAVRQLLERAPLGELLGQHVLQARAHEEVLLLEAQLLALRRRVVRVEDARDVLGVHFRDRGLGVPPGVERLDVERRDGAAGPEPQVIHGRPAVAGDQLVEADGPDVLRVHPAIARAALRVLRGDAAAAETHHVARIVARDLPRAALAQPAARDFALPAVLVDGLREDAEVVADAVAHRRVLQRRERIHEARGQPAEAAVAEARVDLFLRDPVEIEAQLLQRVAGLLHQFAVERREAVDERAAEQVLDREVADALHARLGHAALRRKPARGEFLADRERQRVVHVALRGGVRVLAERAGQTVEQYRAKRAGSEADAAQERCVSHGRNSAVRETGLAARSGRSGRWRRLRRRRAGRRAGRGDRRSRLARSEERRRKVETARLRVELLRIRRGRRDDDRCLALDRHDPRRQVEARPLLRRQVVLVAAAGLRSTTARQHDRGKRGQQEPQRRDAHHAHRWNRGAMQEARIVQPPAPRCGFPRIGAGLATSAGLRASAATAAASPSGTRRSGW